MSHKLLLAATLASLLLVPGPASGKSWTWRFQLPGSCTTNIAVGKGNVVYIGAVDGATRYLYAVNAAGSVRWKKEVPGIRGVSVTPDNVILCSKYRTVAALDSNGVQLWESDQTALVVTSPPAVAPDGTIVVANGYYQDGTGYGKVYAFRPPATAPVWIYPASGYLNGVYHVGIGRDGSIYVPVTGGELLKLDKNGQLQDSVDADVGVTGYRSVSDLAISSGGYVYFGTYASELCAISPSFEVAWRGPAGYDFMQQPAALGSDNKLYMINESQMGYILNALTGAALNSYSLATWYQEGGIALGNDGKIYWASRQGDGNTDRVYCANESTGLEWYAVLGDSNGNDLTSVVMAPDGSLYVSDSESDVPCLYKISTDATGPLDADWPMLHQNPGQTGCAASGSYHRNGWLAAVNLLLLGDEEYDGACDLGTGVGCDSVCAEDADIFIVRFDKDVDEYYLEAYVDDPHQTVASAYVVNPSGGTVALTYELYREDEWFTSSNPYLGADPSFPLTLPQTYTGAVTCTNGKKYQVTKTISSWEWAQ